MENGRYIVYGKNDINEIINALETVKDDLLKEVVHIKKEKLILLLDEISKVLFVLKHRWTTTKPTEI